jgi:hypothetical protein
MLTISMQLAVAFCLFAFAIMAVRVARAFPRHPEVFRFGWSVTGGAFLMQSLILLFHNSLSTAGFAGGEDSAAWNAVVALNPVLNHSRTFLLAAFCVMLCVGLIRAGRGAPPPEPRVWVPALLAGAAVGVVIGLNEGVFSALTHYSRVAVWDLLELLALMGVLFVGLLNGRIDRALWFCLALNAFVLALAVLWFAAFAQIEVAGQWTPKIWMLQAAKVPLYLLMIGIAHSQLRRIGRGEPPRGLLDAQPPRLELSSLH